MFAGAEPMQATAPAQFYSSLINIMKQKLLAHEVLEAGSFSTFGNVGKSERERCDVPRRICSRIMTDPADVTGKLGAGVFRRVMSEFTPTMGFMAVQRSEGSEAGCAFSISDCPSSWSAPWSPWCTAQPAGSC